MSDNGFEPLLHGDGALPTNRQQMADLIRRLRGAADHLPLDTTPREDLKILSQTLRELRRAFTVFAPYRSQRKATIFGSARTPREAATYQAAEQLGAALAHNGWFVVTGASTGIMEAGHRGAGRDRSMGINIMLPFEQAANEIIRDDAKLVTMKYFFTRKLMFVKECDAVVCLPGGFGTLDEAFEVLTLMQTGKRELMPLVFLDAPGGAYWKDWLAYVRRHLLDGGMVSPEDMSLFLVTDSVPATVDEILRFYRVFDDMEYVNNRLVLHLKEPLAAAKQDRIQREFTDILNDGDFRHEVESLNGGAGTARLTFHFNRRSLGRLRQLINTINDAT
ncbi:MAG: TIGR00730 family Rossman fold protein [Pirellulales bacterium]